MKIISLMAALALINQVSAFKPVSISKFNVNYSNPSGTASAQAFSFDGQSFSNPRIDVMREDANLRLAFEDDDVVFEDVSDDILLAQPFTLVNLNALANATKAQMSMESLRFKNPKTDLTASKFAMVCDGFTNEVEEADRYLQSCSNNSIINLGKVSLNSGGSSTTIDDLRMQSKSNRLLFSLQLAGVKATGEGRVRYIHNSNEKLVELKVDRVRAGFFNVTRRFFDALDSLPDNVEVRRPYIFINLD